MTAAAVTPISPLPAPSIWPGFHGLAAVALSFVALATTSATAPASAQPANAPATEWPLAAAEAASAPVSAATSPPPLDCRSLADQAMSTDLKAATAQSQRKGAELLAPLYAEAAGLWQLAAERCEGRARERALRNLKDTQMAGAAISELLGAGAPCAATQRDADALQELAKQASAERRWPDAAILYRKAENMWDAASERCTGAQQAAAIKRRDESDTDGHNAEFCAPLFDRARAQLQRLRIAGAAKPEEKVRLSLIAETGWRDATEQCRGAALDLARNNAQSLARERGTPWAVTREVQVVTAVPVLAPSVAKVALPATSAGAPAALPASPAKPVAAAVVVAEPQAQPMPAEFVAGSARFSGSFVSDIGGATYSGTGKVLWDNGDRFEGSLRKGLRHGKGLFIWTNGQRYEGDWLDDRPQGQGRLRFANGNVWEGAVEAGVPTGEGRMVYASGDSYTGRMQQGIPEGRGNYEWLSGQRFEGEWRNGLAHGQGTLRFANGNRYEGTVHEGQPQGSGRMLFATGDVYAGSFEAGVPHGEGRFVWAAGDEYIGHWKAGLKEGLGVMSWKNGDRWEGLYRDDVQAEGKLVRKDG